jgi:LytS/YehU family sensor histidine kinase
MSSSATAAAPAKSPSRTPAGEVLRSIAGRLTWKTVGVTFAIAVALQAWFAIEVDVLMPEASQNDSARAMSNLLMAYGVMLATLIADEAIDRGAKPLGAYGRAVITGCAVAAVVQLLVQRWLALGADADVAGNALIHIAQAASVFLEYLLWAAIIVMVYANRRTALLALARMNAVQVQRAELQRRVLESQLQALQARVEPQFLFGTLVQMRELYDFNPAQGAQMADDLIAYLRAALPHMRDSNATLAQELKLASAYLSIKQPQKPGIRPAVAAPAGAHSTRVPPMMLLPLVDHMLCADHKPLHAASAIEISVSTHAGTLRLVVSDRNAWAPTKDACGVLGDIRERLRELYGERGKLHVGSSNGRACIVLEIPYDATESHPR